MSKEDRTTVRQTYNSQPTRSKKIPRYQNVSASIWYIVIKIFVCSQIFGPVQSILKFETLEEVIDRANNTNYGLAAGIITQDVEAALHYSKYIEAGVVWYVLI